MAALVQSYPQQTSTVTMLQPRPSSASGMLQSQSQGQTHHQYAGGAAQLQLNAYNGAANVGPNTYRGQTSMVSAAPYAFNSAPGLSMTNFRPQLGPYIRNDQTTSSMPAMTTVYSPETGHGGNRSRYPTAASISASSSSSSELSAGTQQSFTRDDSAITSTASVATRVPRPHSTIITSTPSPVFLAAPHTPTKPSPDRYRRPAQRRAESSGSSTTKQQNPPTSPAAVAPVIPNVNQTHGHPMQITNPLSMNAYQGFTQPPHMSSGTNKITSFSPSLGLRAVVDDMQLRQQPAREEAARYRRRSIHTIDMANQSDAQLRAMAPQESRQSFTAGLRQEHRDPLRSSPFLANRPASSPGRSAGLEAAARNSQAPSAPASKRDSNTLIAPNPTVSAPASRAADEAPPNKSEKLQLVHIPPRGSSTDAAKRMTNSSPLSKPMTMNAESPVSKDSFASNVSAALQTPAKATYAQVVQGARPQSPAAKQLTALNGKDGKKNKTSRLRRAFSFGSAAELRSVTDNNDAAKTTAVEGAERSRLRKERYQDEREAEQARVAQQQEAGGIGQGIYSGQGRFFSGSTDNLSISSTASSASIMIRKMGQGMKKSTRSLVGLFRPKSVVGVPAAQAAAPQLSQAEVSMVTVEAERERVNVNANAHDQAGGGTGFPRLERNSLDAAANVSSPVHARTSSSDSSDARKSILGGDRERAEVLAAVKKGILKRAATDSPQASPRVKPADSKVDGKATNFTLPPLPNMNDSPASSSPSTPNDEAHGHKRSGSVTLGGEDYFMSSIKFQVDSKSVPNTPPGVAKRNATFSPRIQFHDTWPSGEYDRRGEIATCNRLTPMLAQQIKEELNTFKMEMEVHENSKIYTHFF